MLAKQDHLAGRCAVRLGRGLATQLSEDFLCLPVLDLATGDETPDYVVEFRVAGAGRGSEAARMELHVSGLDAARGQRAQRRKILRQADSGHDLRQFARR